MPKVWNIRDPNCPKDAIYVGRPSKWGNPFKIGEPLKLADGWIPINEMTRKQVVNLYRNYIELKIGHGELDISELHGNDLVCWCAPLPCHADVLLELANKEVKDG